MYSYIATVPAVELWHFHLCPATLYRIPGIEIRRFRLYEILRNVHKQLNLK